MPRKKNAPPPPIRYYRCEGDPCRIHRDKDGDLSADAFRTGKGLVKVDPTYVYYNGVPIPRFEYDRMVREKDGICEPSTAPASK